MRRSSELFNIQTAYLFSIILATIYISTIEVNLNYVKKRDLIQFKVQNIENKEKKNVNEKEEENDMEKSINTFDQVKIMDKIKELKGKERSLIPVYRILNGKNNYILKADTLPKNDRQMPFLSNGHIGYRVYGNAVYMNGLYSGLISESHRAWIPNYSNLRVYYCEYNDRFKDRCQYRLNLRAGVFMEHILDDRFELFHLTYAHRAYKHFIVNQIYVKRRAGNGKISLNMLHITGNEEDDEGKRIINDDIIINGEKTTTYNNYEIITKSGLQKDIEDDRFQMENPTILISYNTIPQELIMMPNETFLSLKYLMSVSYETETNVKEDFYDLLDTPDDKLLKLHTDLWNRFWEDSPDIVVNDNDELATIIHSSIFTLASSIPLSLSSQIFYGPMSPNEGYVTADTELWIFPVLNLINTNFSKKLINYRMRNLPVAMEYAMQTGHRGARFPVKSAFSGIEVESNENLLNAIHVTADVSFAMRQYYSLTHDDDWLVREGCFMSKEIANFWASYVVFNETTRYYDINDVTGPDLNYPNVNNELFTNVVVAYSLFFASFTECLCSKIKENYQFNKDEANKFDHIGSHIALLYDENSGTHMKFSDFQLDNIKVLFSQPDVVLLQYPLEYKIQKSQLLANYQMYMTLVNLHNTPSLTYAVHSIAGLDFRNINEANEDFKSSYFEFITSPFNVWCEKNETNYLTGLSAFLQVVFNGYAGIRPHLDHLIIKQPTLLPNSTGFEINGLTYLGSKYNVIVTIERSYVVFKNLNPDIPLRVKTVGTNNILKVQLNEKYEIPEDGLKLRINDKKIHGCKAPLDNLGEKLTEEKNLVINSEKQNNVQQKDE